VRHAHRGAGCSGAATTSACSAATRRRTPRPEAFRDAGRRRSYRDTTISTTLSPYRLCSGLIRQFGIGTVIVGESRTFAGGAGWLRECGVEVIDLDSDECADLLQSFIAAHPAVWDEAIGE
jgi:creatinine deaminase